MAYKLKKMTDDQLEAIMGFSLERLKSMRDGVAEIFDADLYLEEPEDNYDLGNWTCNIDALVEKVKENAEYAGYGVMMGGILEAIDVCQNVKRELVRRKVKGEK